MVEKIKKREMLQDKDIIKFWAERVIGIDDDNLHALENFRVKGNKKKHRLSSRMSFSTMGCPKGGWRSGGTKEQSYSWES